jgi:hypothetical protein
MAVQAGAFVPLGHVGKTVCGFDLEYAENIHGRIVPPTGFPRKLMSKIT